MKGLGLRVGSFGSKARLCSDWGLNASSPRAPGWSCGFGSVTADAEAGGWRLRSATQAVDGPEAQVLGGRALRHGGVGSAAQAVDGP